LREITADISGTACPVLGFGVAFNGVNLLASCYSDIGTVQPGRNTVVEVSPVDGQQVARHTITGQSPHQTGYGALAWDSSRNILWACSSYDYNTVGRIDLTNDTFTYAFTSGGCLDGLAYDAEDDTLWTSGNNGPTVYHYTTTGQFIGSFPSLAPFNCGIAAGDNSLYLLTGTGCRQIYQTPKNLSTSTLRVTLPHLTDCATSISECSGVDLECDSSTFASQGKQVLWSKWGYDNRLYAWEVPAGSCQAPPPVMNPTGRKYCIYGPSTGAGWAWGVTGSEGAFGGSVASGTVAPGGTAIQIASAWVASLNTATAGALTATQFSGNQAHCFRITPGNQTLSVNGCTVTTTGCNFNPTVVEEVPIGGSVELLVHGTGRADLPAGTSYAAWIAALFVAVGAGSWYGARRWLR
jgi:hypothetical protein